jgi:heme exporter protein A
MTLTVTNLLFERNDLPILKDICFQLNKGELLLVRGVNGSGKSTLLRILATYNEPHAGNVLWSNRCIFENRDDYQSQLHYLGHQNGLKPHLTVYENLQLNCALYSIHASDTEIKQAITKVELHTLIDAYAWTLSAGQQRRLALARLLLRSRPLWILDEPTTALDVHGQQLFTHLLTQHLDQGGIAVTSTHHEFHVTGQIKQLQLRETYSA